jgi:hypothetical protein
MPNKTKSEPDVEFEREKWQAELRLRQKELALHERDARLKYLEIRAKRRDERLARWSSPLVLAVLAAALAAFGNAIVAFINGSEQRALERARAEASQVIEETKAEAARILEVIKTNDVNLARNNLDFLNQAGLVTNPKRRADIQAYLSRLKPGEGPSLPSSAAQLEGLGLSQNQIRTIQRILAEEGIAPENQSKTLLAWAQALKQLQLQVETIDTQDDQELVALKKKFSEALESGDIKALNSILPQFSDRLRATLERQLRQSLKPSEAK